MVPLPATVLYANYPSIKLGGGENFKCRNKMRIKVKGSDKIDIRKVDFFKGVLLGIKKDVSY